MSEQRPCVVNELVYAGAEVEKLVKEKYPEAKLTDASDFIHTERFECEIEGVEEDEFYIFAIREGFAECCFGFLLRTHDPDPGGQRQVWDWVAEAQALDASEKISSLQHVVEQRLTKETG